MTLPNKLNMVRVIVIPLMIVLCYIPWLKENTLFLGVSWLYFLLVILFILASVTDFLDGAIARKYQLITTFGKLADPLADKMLVFTAMTVLMMDGFIPMWVYIVILIREFMVSGIRMVVIEKGTVIAAAKLGKWKTFVTMVAIIVLFFSGLHEIIEIIGTVLIYLACALTILSGIEYFYNNRKDILESI